MDKPIRLRLDQITVDVDLQPRIGGIDADHVRALEESVEHWGPLVVVRLDGRYVLVDGFHRLAAAQDLELESVEVRILDSPEDGDLRGLAFDLNVRHGRPLSLADRRTEAGRVLRMRPELSDREIGRRCGLTQPTVARVREHLEASAQIEHTETRVGRGGYTYSPTRRAGSLPDEGIGNALGNLGARMFSGRERARQRRVTGYLRRLVVALEDQSDLLEDVGAAAEAVRLVLGDESAEALATRLGTTAEAVIALAEALGYEED